MIRVSLINVIYHWQLIRVSLNNDVLDAIKRKNAANVKKFMVENEYVSEPDLVMPLPEEAIELVTAGNAKRHLLNTETAIIRKHRGVKQVYLNRDRIDLENPSYVTALVYTKDAFIKDRMAEEKENQKTLQLSEKEISFLILFQIKIKYCE